MRHPDEAAPPVPGVPREAYRDAMNQSPPPSRRIPWDALAVAPFVIFAVMFLFLPTLSLVGGAFTDRSGNFTLDNIAGLFTDQSLPPTGFR